MPTLREQVARAIATYVGQHSYEAMALHRNELRSKIKDGYDVNEPTRADCEELADDIIALLIPPGHVVVPMEPTREMLNAAPAREDPGEESMYATIYRAMLAARPACEGKP